MITERKSVYSASNGTDRLKKGDVREREREREREMGGSFLDRGRRGPEEERKSAAAAGKI